ncbi:unnamed protein product [Rhizophagus irregularis]|nr:unnamed protein product [Rhizophagus irregularis]
MNVVLKKLSSSKYINSGGLNEIKMFYKFILSMASYDPCDNDGDLAEAKIKRPTAFDIESKIRNILLMESDNCRDNNPTKIIKSPDIGPITINNPDFIYKSRSLSTMINSVESTEIFTKLDPYQSSDEFFNDKRELDINLIEERTNKKIKLTEIDDDDDEEFEFDRLTKESEFDQYL